MEPENILVAIEDIPYSADKLYEYALTEEIKDIVVPGTIVLCPFGNGNRSVRGIVVKHCLRTDAKVKHVQDICDVSGYLGEDELRLCNYMKNKYFCTFFDAAKTVMPAGALGDFDRIYSLCSNCGDEVLDTLFWQYGNRISRKKLLSLLPRNKFYKILNLVRFGGAQEILQVKNVISDRKQTVVQLDSSSTVYADKCRKKGSEIDKKHLAIISYLAEHGPSTVKEVLYMTGLSDSVIKTLNKRGVLKLSTREIFRNPLKNKHFCSDPGFIVLNKTQQQVAGEICSQLGTGRTHLLYGVTGSGKTHVFMRIIDCVLEKGESALILLPEISLTLQIIERFYQYYGDKVAVLHSALSIGERYDEYKRIRSGAARIVIGTRSAVFAPVQKLGVIIIDEEQEHTYKSDMTPKYHARDIAAFLVHQKNALLLLASATPSFESFNRAMKGDIGFSRLDERFNQQPLPKVLVADMAMEQANGNLTVISNLLASELQKNLQRGEQTILFMNRRGYNSFVSCPMCKFVYKCPNCGIPMTFHKINNHLICHYCGYTVSDQHKCPSCGSETMRYSGFGTQKVEDELKQNFPGIRILRMDADTVGTKSSRDEILTSFGLGKQDVLLGTQMITKGLDFANVTLVGVLMADMSLYSSDFRAYEKTFSLLTQVIGRAGRAEKEGRAVIQTYSPEHIVLEYAFKQDYEGFYKEETALRKSLIYPPFCDVCQVIFLADALSAAFEGAEAFVHKVEMLLQETYNTVPVSIIRPKQTAVPKVGGRNRVRVLIKCRDNQQTRRMLHDAYTWYLKEKIFKNTTISIDINPSMIV